MSHERRDEGLDGSTTEACFGSAGGAPPSAPAGVSIWFFHREGIERADLAPGHSLVAGRNTSSDVRIPDGVVSATHARFTLQDGQVFVEDLGSRNGTHIGRQRIQHMAAVPVGAEVMLGTVIVRVFPRVTTFPAAMDGDGPFSSALDEELKRADHCRRTFGLLAVRAADGEVEHESWATQLRARLRPFDRVMLYKRDTALVLLPEVAEEEAEAIARDVASGSEDPAGPRRVGVAVFPMAGSSAAKLRDEALAASGRATKERPVVIASAAKGDVRAGDQHVSGPSQGELFRQAKLLASSPIAVLIQGESGTGKEVVARYLHEKGPRRGRPFIPVNCAALTDTLLQSELFGHEKGSFTGAIQRRHGCFEAAHGGTLFLDEVAELKPDAQATLLRTLETHTITRLGSNHAIQVDVRIVSATHRDLRAMVKEGRFREDLYFRLAIATLRVLPLRERLDELDDLVELLLMRAAEEHRRMNGHKQRRALRVSPDARVLLRAYPWPGNVRELQGALARGVALAPGDTILPDHLMLRLPEAPPAERPRSEASGAPPPAPPAELKKHTGRGGLRAVRQPVEVQSIEDALRESNGNQTEAAKRLHISPRHMRRKVKALGLKPPRK